jgi:hypothetical protein
MYTTAGEGMNGTQRTQRLPVRRQLVLGLKFEPLMIVDVGRIVAMYLPMFWIFELIE